MCSLNYGALRRKTIIKLPEFTETFKIWDKEDHVASRGILCKTISDPVSLHQKIILPGSHCLQSVILGTSVAVVSLLPYLPGQFTQALLSPGLNTLFSYNNAVSALLSSQSYLSCLSCKIKFKFSLNTLGEGFFKSLRQNIVVSFCYQMFADLTLMNSVHWFATICGVSKWFKDCHGLRLFFLPGAWCSWCLTQSRYTQSMFVQWVGRWMDEWMDEIFELSHKKYDTWLIPYSKL